MIFSEHEHPSAPYSWMEEAGDGSKVVQMRGAGGWGHSRGVRGRVLSSGGEPNGLSGGLGKELPASSGSALIGARWGRLWESVEAALGG